MSPIIYAMIPARAGSERLKIKNLSLLDGKPLISYSILAAKDSGIFNKIIINSDNDSFLKTLLIKKIGSCEHVAILASIVIRFHFSQHNIMTLLQSNQDVFFSKFHGIRYRNQVIVTKQLFMKDFPIFEDFRIPILVTSTCQRCIFEHVSNHFLNA